MRLLTAGSCFHVRHKPFDELQRLGLTPATENEVRKEFPTETGMLVVDNVRPAVPILAPVEAHHVFVCHCIPLVTTCMGCCACQVIRGGCSEGLLFPGDVVRGHVRVSRNSMY